jgi:hypothetical protein
MCRHIRIQICNTSSFEAAPRLHFDCSDSENQTLSMELRIVECASIQIQFQFGGRLSLGSESVAIDTSMLDHIAWGL